jgi:hypothetical protein
MLIFLIAGWVPQAPCCADSALRQSGEPPVIPIGMDAYRMWDKLPYQRIGIRAYMRSTYDREGNNRTADASHYLYQQSDEFNVTLDVKVRWVVFFFGKYFCHLCRCLL